MKIINRLPLIITVLLWLNLPLLAQVKSQTYKNLSANDPAKKTCFSFSQNKIVEETEKWDIAFSKTTIFVNGTFATVEKSFEEVKNVDNQSFISGTNGKNPSIREWYEYDSASHLIQVAGGKTYLIKSMDGKQIVKLRIISYYQDAPQFPEPGKDKSGVFTFEYMIAKEGKEF